MLFRYNVPDVNQLDVVICTYEAADYNTVVKSRTDPAYVVKKYIGKAEIIRDVIGDTMHIKLINVKESKPPFHCTISYNTVAYYSGIYYLIVYGKYLGLSVL